MPNADQLTAEQILIDHGIGETIQPREEGYDKKKALYQRENLWSKYLNLRGMYSEKFTSPKDNFVDRRLANKIAQKDIDNQLFAKVRGTLPTEAELSDPADDQLISRERFGKNLNAAVDNVASVDYIYINFGFNDNEPEDAPNPGAYFHLIRLQNNKEDARDFFKTIWPKTIPSKSVIEDARNRNDDGRDTFRILDRLSAAYNASQE